MSKILFWISLILTSCLLGSAYLLKGIWLGTILLLIPAMMMIISLRVPWSWMPSLGLIFFMISAAAGLLFDLMPVMVLAGVTAAIITWDLVRFQRRLREIEQDFLPPILEKRHLVRLFSVSVPGFLIPAIALQVKYQPSFGLIIGIVLLLALSLSRVMRLILKGKDQSS